MHNIFVAYDQSSIEEQLTRIEGKVDAAYRSSEKMRKYFLITLIVSVAVIIIPLLILPLVLPSFLDTISAPAGL